jgi:7-cyano-7-deazaguanine synthase
MSSSKSSVIVVLSGGQDSTTCLYWALKNYQEVKTITFDYGQRHRIELDAAKKVAEVAGVHNEIFPINTFERLGGNSLTGNADVESSTVDGQLPNTFVPGRNLIFLTFAAAFAYQRGIKDIVTGVCQTDYSGYPDCRQNTIEALQVAVNLGMDYQVKILTPLMWMTKSETVHLAKEVGALKALAWSHTCYNGEVPPCGECPACILREKGFNEAGIKDPLIERTN